MTLVVLDVDGWKYQYNVKNTHILYLLYLSSQDRASFVWHPVTCDATM